METRSWLTENIQKEWKEWRGSLCGLRGGVGSRAQNSLLPAPLCGEHWGWGGDPERRVPRQDPSRGQQKWLISQGTKTQSQRPLKFLPATER